MGKPLLFLNAKVKISTSLACTNHHNKRQRVNISMKNGSQTVIYKDFFKVCSIQFPSSNSCLSTSWSIREVCVLRNSMVINRNRSFKPSDWFNVFLVNVLRFLCIQTQIEADTFDLTQSRIYVQQECRVFIKCSCLKKKEATPSVQCISTTTMHLHSLTRAKYDKATRCLYRRISISIFICYTKHLLLAAISSPNKPLTTPQLFHLRIVKFTDFLSNKISDMKHNGSVGQSSAR